MLESGSNVMIIPCVLRVSEPFFLVVRTFQLVDCIRLDGRRSISGTGR